MGRKVRKLNTKKLAVFIGIVLISFICLAAIIDKIAFESNKKAANINYQLTINGEDIEANEIISKKNFLFDHSKDKYTQVKVPKNSEINLENSFTLTNEEGETLNGDITYLNDGKYTLKTQKGDFKYVYYLEVDNDFFTEIDDTHAKQGGYIIATIYDLNEDEEVEIDAEFVTSKDFLFDNNQVIIPIDFSNKAGEYELLLKSEQSTNINNVTVKDNTGERIVIYWEDYEKKTQEETDEFKDFVKATQTITPDKLYTSFYIPAKGTVVSDFGDTFHVNNSEEPTITNLAIDFSHVLDTPISTTSDGEVVFVGEFEIAGKVIAVNHGYGIVSTYSHLNEIDVKVGQKVDYENSIAKMGETGNVRGSHLNFEIYINGIKVDPNIFLYEDIGF